MRVAAATAALLTPSGAAALPRADPSTSWLSYAQFDAAGTITAMNATWVVPQDPAKAGADPSFWFGLQTAKGTGALIQPILAWGQMYSGYGIWHEVYDWNTGRDSRSPQSYSVKAGDTLTAAVKYVPASNSYDMLIFHTKAPGNGKSISWNYKLSSGQKVPETTAYIVVEHQPRSCDEFPPKGITFTDIYVEVENKEVKSPAWVPKQERSACSSKAVVVDDTTVALQWDTTAAVV